MKERKTCGFSNRF
jgi:hypothetical protein